jgi:hypothetical protein
MSKDSREIELKETFIKKKNLDNDSPSKGRINVEWLK